jgi:hypothetical protein
MKSPGIMIREIVGICDKTINADQVKPPTGMAIIDLTMDAPPFNPR